MCINDSVADCRLIKYEINRVAELLLKMYSAPLHFLQIMYNKENTKMKIYST